MVKESGDNKIKKCKHKLSRGEWKIFILLKLSHAQYFAADRKKVFSSKGVELN